MADTVQTAFANTGATLYFIVRNRAGQVWNTSGSAFEAYNASNWTDYAIAMTEQGASRVYVGNFPALATGPYGVTIYEQAAGTEAVTDDPVWSGGGDWDGDNEQFMSLAEAQASIEAACATVDPDAVAAVILTTPANLLATDAAGNVTLTSASASAVATAVWSAATRTLTSFGSLATTVAAAVWAYATRTLTAFGFTVDTSEESAIKAVTDKLNTALELDGAVYRFTVNALEQAPSGGDATAANQTAIADAIANLNNISADDVVAALFAETLDGTVTFEVAQKILLSALAGKRTITSPGVHELYAEDGTTLLREVTAAAGGRTVTG